LPHFGHSAARANQKVLNVDLAVVQWGVFMKNRNRGYWIAGAFLWGLTSAALAEVAGTPPAKPTANTSSTHAHSPRTRHAAASKAATKQTAKQAATQTPKQPESDYSGALSQYQFAYGKANVPFAPEPQIGDPGYAGNTAESEILKRNSTRYGAPATPASPASSALATAPDDNWRFMANPLINATHIHEIGAAVSARHDF
jgi:hypothetical protein